MIKHNNNQVDFQDSMSTRRGVVIMSRKETNELPAQCVVTDGPILVTAKLNMKTVITITN